MNEQRKGGDLRPTGAVEYHLIGDHRAGMDVAQGPELLEPFPAERAVNEKAEAGRNRGDIDQQQRKASARAADQVVAPWEACDHNQRKSDQTDGAIDKN